MRQMAGEDSARKRINSSKNLVALEEGGVMKARKPPKPSEITTAPDEMGSNPKSVYFVFC